MTAANESQRCYLRGLYCVQDCAATSHKDCPRYLAGESPLPLSANRPRYATVVADPPWDAHAGTTGITWGDADSRGWGSGPTTTRQLSYPTLSVAEIASLPAADLAERDSHLFLWATSRTLSDAFGVLTAWGFSYVCTLTWCKAASGSPMGGAFKSNTEFILYGKRGHPETLGGANTRWFTWKRPYDQRGKPHHSAKPEAFLDLVESVCPGPYLELFARRNRLGWDTWGDESFEHVEVVA